MRKIQLNLSTFYKWVCLNRHITAWKGKSFNEIYSPELSSEDSYENKWKVPFLLSRRLLNVQP